MASQNQNGFRTFQASPAIGAFLAVDIQSDGTITPVAGNASVGIGVLQEDAAAGGYATVRLWTAPGTVKLQVSGTAITPGLTQYAIITGGYAGAINGTFAPANLKAINSAVASNGIIVEFTSLI